jgi:guanylate kinase
MMVQTTPDDAWMEVPSKWLDRGLLVVISGPSGVGKGTVVRALMQDPDADGRSVRLSVSVTTRKPRPGEVEGVSYFFRTHEEFDELVQNGALLEWAEYQGNRYGTPRTFVEAERNAGRDVILEIDVQGGRQIRERGEDAIYIFMVPPSMDELAQRLTDRATEDAARIAGRLGVARDEMRALPLYDYLVINDEVPAAVTRIRGILQAEHCRVAHLRRE